MHNFCEVSLVLLIIRLDIVVVGVLEVSCRIPSMTYTVMEASESDHVSNILVYEF